MERNGLEAGAWILVGAVLSWGAMTGLGSTANATEGRATHCAVFQFPAKAYIGARQDFLTEDTLTLPPGWEPREISAHNIIACRTDG